jgi:hypothetical protein
MRALIAAALLTLSPWFSHAQEAPAFDPTAPGRLTAFVYRDVPAAAAIKVTPFDDSRENRRLAQAFERALDRNGRKVDQRGGTLSLSFTTEVTQSGRPGPSSGTLGVIEGSRDEARVRLNLYSTTQDSLAAGPRRSDGGTPSVRYMLTAIVEDASGSRLWQASATLNGTPAEEQAAYAAMAGVIAEEIGKMVRQRSFRIE